MPRFVCQSAACRREVTLQPVNGTGCITNPRCTCGSEMRRAYSKPLFRELSRAEALLLLGDDDPQYASWGLFHEKNIDDL